ncbi:indole-3-glycerol phosphate synthase [Anaerovirgula multivorans]|uniref:Indole-3-glycerol phosphate synthase n=1 Tax=Anaerovirgula multivorans TaxID=312168 RepID=A0A239HK93_9FIRM|nr:indole-3-glycerol phosphate synthase TrpC [Anaerovirgula multivorans]SNS81551.1 indole-3-glycerol phosphate synthase [Anaerovirgula multivorans]
MILDEITAYKRKKVEEEKQQLPMSLLLKQLEDIEAPKDFKKALKREKGLSIIAEVKKASPSKGIIREDFHPLEIADLYEENKVEAISVLTEDKFFQGSPQYLKEIRRSTSLPLLRKDFIIDPYQIYQSKFLGADAILLIAAILTGNQLIDFQKIAMKMGLYCLVEVHTQEELEKVLETEADIIGINNRNLKTFETTLDTTKELMAMIPKEKIIVSESGIHGRRDMEFLEEFGVDGVLIGEGLMRASSIGEKLRELRGEAV